MPRLKDVIVFLPGIMGSVLQRNGKDVWAPSLGGVFNALSSRLNDVQALRLTTDPADQPDLGDGIVATRLMPSAQIIPGFWKIDGYSQTGESIKRVFDNVIPGRNYFEFPYDWRRDNRVAAKRLQTSTAQWLSDWRCAGDGDPDARLIIIAHSMGGLIARYYLEVLGGWRSTRALVTFGTPYSGSLNALSFLANGFKKAFGLVDFSPMLRSFTSVYQLLPNYKCLDYGTGELVHVDDPRGIANVDAHKVAAALAFHQEIVDSQKTNGVLPDYASHGYRIYPVVGTHQPTLQSARITAGATGAVQLLGSYDGEDFSGDGTVPRVSATPREWQDPSLAMFVADKHACLQYSGPVLDYLDGLLTGFYMQTAIQRDLNQPAADADNALAVATRRSSGLVRLRVSIDDAFGPAEAIVVRARPDGPIALLKAVIEDAATEDFVAQQELALIAGDAENSYIADFPPLPAGLYRITVKGDQTVLPVSDLFAVYPEPRVSLAPMRGEAAATEGATALDLQGATAALERESAHITRYPAIDLSGELRAGGKVTLSIDLALVRDLLTSTTGVDLTVPDNWIELTVTVKLVAPDLVVRNPVGTILLRNGKPSIPWIVSAIVGEDLAAPATIEVRATFEYDGRYSGSARRAFKMEAAPASAAPAKASAVPPPAAFTTASPSSPAQPAAESMPPLPRVSAPQAPLMGTAGKVSVDTAARAPALTIEIFSLSTGVLYWHLSLPSAVLGQCELPGRLSGKLNLTDGTNPVDPPAYVAALFATASTLTAPGHIAFFEGLGERLYELTPSFFKETYWELVRVYQQGFAIQIISDDPYIPWELMRPSDKTHDADYLGVRHPVARWFLDYEGTRHVDIPPGNIATFAPDYTKRPNVAPLNAAQRESKAILELLADRATHMDGKAFSFIDVFADSQKSNYALVHFAGHGTCKTDQTDMAYLLLEDEDVHVLQLRRAKVLLGANRHSLVFLNACQVGQSGLNLSVIGGFAEALMNREFGGLVAPLWSVYDDPAKTCTTRFIADVFKGATFAQALQTIRAEFGEVSPTYLSYLYYGDVMAAFR